MVFQTVFVDPARAVCDVRMTRSTKRIATEFRDLCRVDFRIWFRTQHSGGDDDDDDYREVRITFRKQ